MAKSHAQQMGRTERTIANIDQALIHLESITRDGFCSHAWPAAYAAKLQLFEARQRLMDGEKYDKV